MDCSPPGSSVHEDSPGKNTGVGCHALLQGIFPTQGQNPGLLHCRRILYCLSHQGNPASLVELAYFSHLSPIAFHIQKLEHNCQQGDRRAEQNHHHLLQRVPPLSDRNAQMPRLSAPRCHVKLRGWLVEKEHPRGYAHECELTWVEVEALPRKSETSGLLKILAPENPFQVGRQGPRQCVIFMCQTKSWPIT